MKYLQSLMIIALLSLSLFSLPILSANCEGNLNELISLQQGRRRQLLHVSNSDQKHVHVQIKKRGGSVSVGVSAAVGLKSSTLQVYSFLGFSVFFALFLL
ncbi:hypothetical protein ABFS82_11G031700 [Erythranthe guttata]|uniref:Transmembrane protein n=1 Tax=Erythranthe guttata TaxID=4155 RepID=A0A022R2Y9_ERYGU|nr:hypothetical protein MIMGU_mgv1a016956mg [Erythranthe guttata]